MSDERDGTLGEVIDRRVQVYGNPVETFARIANVWSGIIGYSIAPHEVPLMLAGMKMVRTQVTPDYSDNSDDVAGYMDIFQQIMEPTMIRARTVEEYLAQKDGAEGQRQQRFLTALADAIDEHLDDANRVDTPISYREAEDQDMLSRPVVLIQGGPWQQRTDVDAGAKRMLTQPVGTDHSLWLHEDVAVVCGMGLDGQRVVTNCPVTSDYTLGGLCPLDHD